MIYLSLSLQDLIELLLIQLTIINKHTDADILDIKKNIERVDGDSSYEISQIKMKLSRIDETKIIRLFVEDSIDQCKKELQLAIQREDEDLDIKIK